MKNHFLGSFANEAILLIAIMLYDTTPPNGLAIPNKKFCFADVSWPWFRVSTLFKKNCNVFAKP